MSFIADLHIHSKYSRATSKECCPESLDYWARIKGVDLVATGDFTHVAWRLELREKLTQSANGLYTLKSEFRRDMERGGRDVNFIISGEISSIYKKNGKTRKVHNVIVLPDLESADKLSAKLEVIGNLRSDGRPILGLDSKVLLDMTLSVCPTALFIPAHIWTPHFSVLGANSGFDDIEECFEDLTPNIYALETGLSSDPPMNWRCSQLDRFALVSNSDAHSPGNLAREANIFDTALSYDALFNAFKTNDRRAFIGTIEFFPEEGKYHFDGHRACKIQWEPSRTIAANGICPVCGGKLTVGVLHRVEQLADRPERFEPADARKFERIVPLSHVVGACIGSPSNSVKVARSVSDMVAKLGPELSILRTTPLHDIKTAADDLISEGIRRVRAEQLYISAGYDGEYGVVEIFTPQERDAFLGQTEILGHLTKRTNKKKTSVTTTVTVKKNEKIPSISPPGENEAHPYGLNTKQWEAVSRDAKAIAVIAGPGTGKTHTLISRIAYLVNEKGVHPAAITAVTFTVKASREMQRRLTPLFKDRRDLAMPRIGTFHAICMDLLRSAFHERTFAVIDRPSALGIAKQLTDLPLKPSDFLQAISRAKAGGPQAIEELPEKMIWALREYQVRLGYLNALDFDDILLEAMKLFTGETNGAARSGFDHVLVDEFQDINETQYQLVRLWTRTSGSVFVIGDPHQSIYGFRGASPKYFERFTQDFPGACVVGLTRNYRSPAPVITVAQSVIRRAADAAQYATAIETVSAGGRPVRIVETQDEFSEAVFIAKEINRLVGGVDMLDAQVYSDSGRAHRPGTRSFSDIAVLYRTHRQASVIERCLIQEGIQYRVAGDNDFFSNDLVRYSLAFFRFVLHPGDIFSLLACCNHCKVTDALAVVTAYGAAEGGFDALREQQDGDRFFIDRKALSALEALVTRYRAKLQSESHITLVNDWIVENDAEGQSALSRLVHYAEMYPDMESMLSAITSGSDADVVRRGAKTTSSDAVSLTTLHAAKGLEYPVVFVCGVNDGVLPLRAGVGSETDLEEERRLFYVGLTRAKEELICTYSRKRTIQGMTGACPPSTFLSDMGRECVIKETYRLEAAVKQMSFL